MAKTSTDRIIAGIDPGLSTTGVGILVMSDGGIRLLDTLSVSTRPSTPLPKRLERIYEELLEFFRRWRPETAAVESIFFARNVRSAMALAHARAAAILAASTQGAAIAEYSPLEIKQAVAGYGRAGKEQVQRMVRTLLGPAVESVDEHAADALACALCHGFRQDRIARFRAAGAADGEARAVLENLAKQSNSPHGTTPAKALLAQAYSTRGKRRGRR